MYQYVPIVRSNDFTWESVGQLSQRGGLIQYSSTESDDDPVIPLVEVLTRDDLTTPERYSNRFSEVFVDTPLYHGESEFSSEQTTNTAAFHNENTDDGNIPVVSQNTGPDGGVIDYSPLASGLDALSSEFGTVATRIMLPSIEFTEGQKNQLRNIESKMGSDDVVLIDVLDIEAGIGQIYRNADWISDEFSEHRIFLLNAFDPHNGAEFAHNYGPVISKIQEIAGYGDYMLERREMPNGNPVTRNRVIRYYDPDEFKRVRIVGEGYDGAASELIDTAYVSASHCDYCRRFLQTVNHNRASCKEFQMGHYVQAMRDHLIEMSSYPPEDLDMDGYNNLTKHLGFDNNGNEEGIAE